MTFVLFLSPPPSPPPLLPPPPPSLPPSPPLPPDSWCYSSLISCLLSVDKPHLALLIISKALHDGASLPPPSRPSTPSSPAPSLRPGLESGVKEVLASAVAALEEKGMDSLGDFVWREGRRKGWVEDCWSEGK